MAAGSTEETASQLAMVCDVSESVGSVVGCDLLFRQVADADLYMLGLAGVTKVEQTVHRWSLTRRASAGGMDTAATKIGPCHSVMPSHRARACHHAFWGAHTSIQSKNDCLAGAPNMPAALDNSP